jgi:hypothetical protein
MYFPSPNADVYNGDFILQEGTTVGTTYQNAEYNNFTGSPITDPLFIPCNNPAPAYLCDAWFYFTFNAAGISYINSMAGGAPLLQLVLRSYNRDYLNSPPSDANLTWENQTYSTRTALSKPYLYLVG